LVVIGLRIDNVKRYVHLTNEQPESFDVAKASEQSVEAVKNTKSMPVDSLKTLQSGPVIAPGRKEDGTATKIEENALKDTKAEGPTDPALEAINAPEYPHTLGSLRVEKGMDSIENDSDCLWFL